jgi:hypothetical protein
MSLKILQQIKFLIISNFDNRVKDITVAPKNVLGCLEERRRK